MCAVSLSPWGERMLTSKSRRCGRGLKSGSGPRAPIPPGLRWITSASMASLNKGLTAHWSRVWAESRRGRVSYRLQPQPTPKVLGKFRSCHRAFQSVPIQMRIGKIVLRSFLFPLKLADEPDCTACGSGDRQTVQHILLYCSKFSHLRAKVMLGTERSTDLRKLLRDETQAQRTARFMILTRLLPQFIRVADEIEQDTHSTTPL
jgi:hypothetical protein